MKLLLALGLLIAFNIKASLDSPVILLRKHKTIVKFISRYNQDLTKSDVVKLANTITYMSYLHDIDPYITATIISVESHFTDKTNRTGDYSIAQINYRIWRKELKKRGRTLSKALLKNSQSYVLHIMCLILQTIKQRRYNKRKPFRWIGYYHSATPKLYKKYMIKIRKRLRVIYRMDRRKIRRKSL